MSSLNDISVLLITLLMKSEDQQAAATKINFNFNFSWALLYYFWKWYFVPWLSSATFFFWFEIFIGLISNVSDKSVTPASELFKIFSEIAGSGVS